MKSKCFSALAAIFLSFALFAAVPLAASAESEADVNYVKGKDFDLYTSSTVKGYTDTQKQPKHMLDGKLSTYWSSAWINEKQPKCEEYILFDLRDVVKIESVTLTARDDGEMFPDGFAFCWSTSNEVEIPIEGQSYTGYENAENNVNTFTFEKPVVAQYLKMNITSRTPGANNIHLVCIAEASVKFGAASEAEKKEAKEKDASVERPLVVNDPVLPYQVSTSSYLDDKDNWLPEHLNDGLATTQWCSEWVSTANEEDEIYVTMALGDPQKATGVIITTQGVCFPKDFRFQYTFDNTNWLDIPGAVYTDFQLDGSLKYVFPFNAPQVATAIRLKVTKKTADPSGNYLVQLAEVDVRGFAPTAEEIKTAQEAFNKAIGNLPDDENKKPTPIPATPEDFMTGCKASGAASCVLAAAAALITAVVLIVKKEGKHE